MWNNHQVLHLYYICLPNNCTELFEQMPTAKNIHTQTKTYMTLFSATKSDNNNDKLRKIQDITIKIQWKENYYNTSIIARRKTKFLLVTEIQKISYWIMMLL